MGSCAKYVFAIRHTSRNHEVVIVPKDFWENNHRLFGDYIPDHEMNDRLEDAGLIECMENTYSIENGMSDSEVVQFMKNNFCVVQDKELENFINGGV